ncbi:MAG: sigma-70 family RNA polymerase sigma factor [Verrucomicrobiales bacterium]
MDPSNRQTPRDAASPDETPDTTLVERSQGGDLHSFDVLVTRYRGKIYGIIYNLVRNESDAWDLAQDVFVKAWRALPRFQGQSAFFTWLYRIAHNVALDWMRARKIQSGVEFDDTLTRAIETEAPTAPREERQPDKRMADSELGERINAALAELSPEHRAVILLREVDGLSYEEIAERIECSLGTVMSRLFYARKRLQSLLEDVYRSPDWH